MQFVFWVFVRFACDEVCQLVCLVSMHLLLLYLMPKVIQHWASDVGYTFLELQDH